MIRRPTIDPANPCVWCGYDLRENPEGTPCPECGRTFGEADPRLLEPRVVAPLRNSTRLLVWSVPAVAAFILAALFAPVGCITLTMAALLVLSGFAGLLRLLGPLDVARRPLLPLAGMTACVVGAMLAFRFGVPVFATLATTLFVLVLAGWAATLTWRTGRRFDHDGLTAAGHIGRHVLRAAGVLVGVVAVVLGWRLARGGRGDASFASIAEVYVPVAAGVSVLAAGVTWMVCMRGLTRFFDRVWASIEMRRRQGWLPPGARASG